jgi:uncharacterized SAM-binding protein YcdF (DUF218 family)
MYFFIKALLRSLVLPPASPLIVMLLGAWMMWRRNRFGGAVLALGFSTLWVLSTPLAADALWRLAEHYPALDLSQPTDSQAIVILGGGGQRRFAPEYGGPAPEGTLLERLDYGAFVARRTGLPVLVTGAPVEAAAMQAALVRDFGVTPRWVENQSRDTFENARLSARILRPLGISRIILVTSSTHLWRAAHEFEDAGFRVVPGPAGVWAPRDFNALRLVPGPAALLRSNEALYELIGEPARRVQAALGLRERLDPRVGAP